MAGRIVAWRETNQKFHSIEELQEVPGIGPKVFANLKALVRI
jgi:competence protein ComEA